MARRPGRKPSGRAGQPAGAQPARVKRLEHLPAWLSAIAAVLGVLLTALVIFGLVRDPDSPPAATADVPASPVAAAPRVTLESVVTTPDRVSAEGRYENIDPTRETVLFIGQPAEDEAATWLPVEAELLSEGGSEPASAGRWQAVRPGVSGSYRWYAVVAPAVPGAGGSLEDLAELGPASEYVRAASGEALTD